MNAAGPVEEFLSHLAVERRTSAHTLDAYRRDLSALAEWAAVRSREVPALKAEDIRAFVAAEHRRGLSPKSLQRRLSACRSFYGWLVKQGRIDASPAAAIRSPKAPRKLPQVLDPDEAKALVDRASRRELLSNRLVIVVATEDGNPMTEAADLASAKVRILALAEPQTVPAGIYAKAYLEKAGLWEQVAGKVVPTENVRAALAAVESGDADAAIVYATDARASDSVQVLETFPASSHPPIRYPAAVLAGSTHPEAEAFRAYLGSGEAQAIFARHGFGPNE